MIAVDGDDDVLDVLSFGAKISNLTITRNVSVRFGLRKSSCRLKRGFLQVLGLVVQYGVSKYWIWSIEGLWWIRRIHVCSFWKDIIEDVDATYKETVVAKYGPDSSNHPIFDVDLWEYCSQEVTKGGFLGEFDM
uniref:Uncharacterized protein n=1 Tax=Tanacetum cinerariifolium TaxID=118510 RepID=A0A6L2M1S9_TANCI|nr:hypothetical protein [Tanacetum cinerariifolium]